MPSLSLSVSNRLGRGAYSSVYRVVYNGKTYAAKCNSMDNKTTFIGCVCELNIASVCMNHPNIISLQMYSFCKPFTGFVSPRNHSRDDPLCLFFECADYNLAQLLTKVKCTITQPEDIDSFKELAIQMLLGIEFMHRNRIVHRDIKPTNILLFDPAPDDPNSPITIKLCDFGLSKHYPTSGCMTPGVCTPLYRAPEVCKCEVYTSKVDIWSLGCVFYEILYDKPLIVVTVDDSQQVLNRIQAVIPDRNITKWSTILKDAPTDLIELISNMLTHDPAQRWSAERCLKSPFFATEIERINMMIDSHPVTLEFPYIVEDNLYVQEIVKQIRQIFTYSRRCRWYSDRMIFIALNLAYKFVTTINYSDTIVPNAPLHAMVMIYLAIKYLNTLETNPTWMEVVPAKMTTPLMMQRAKEMERTILRYLECRVYWLTPYDLSETKLKPRQVRQLLDIMTNLELIHGKTPTDIIKMIA